MIEQLDTPEMPVVKANTHVFTERIVLNYSEDGTAFATVTKVKGYFDNDTFVKDQSSRFEITSDGVELEADTKTSDIGSIVSAKVQDKAERVAAAKAQREIALKVEP